ncbi:MAG TPA: STAS domain-containing protein [Phycisphaerales bacterium]|nr:STAS domain-containing protein [Phycisphaerales bacterium]
MRDETKVRVDVTTEGTTAIVAAHGEIGTHEATQLGAGVTKAFDARPRRIIVDLAGVPYMATSGIATLVAALQRAKKSEVGLIICGVQERVQAVFDISRLTNFFTIVKTVDDAKARA